MINDYGYKPDPIFFGEDGQQAEGEAPYYFGVELEVDGLDDKHDFDDDLQDMNLEEIYLKNDASLSYGGVEIVCFPMTREAHKKYDWEAIMDLVKQHGGSSHNAGNCGLHIHISKKAFENENHKAKFVGFYEKYYDEFAMLLRRNDSQIRSWCMSYQQAYTTHHCVDGLYDWRNGSTNVLNNIINEIFPKAHTGKYSTDLVKNTAMNVVPKNTIEFRGFRGTLKHNSFIAGIQFLDELINFVKRFEIADFDNVEFSDFLNYIMKGNGRNKELIQYIFEMIDRAKRRNELTAKRRRAYLNEGEEEEEIEAENIESDTEEIEFNFIE